MEEQVMAEGDDSLGDTDDLCRGADEIWESKKIAEVIIEAVPT